MHSRSSAVSARTTRRLLAELGEERLVEAERRLDLGDDALLLLGGQVERVEAGAVAVLVDLRLRDLREVVERDAGAVELEGAVEDAADRLAAGQVAEVARVVVRDQQRRPLGGGVEQSLAVGLGGGGVDRAVLAARPSQWSRSASIAASRSSAASATAATAASSRWAATTSSIVA